MYSMCAKWFLTNCFVRVRSYVKKNYLNWNISDDQKRIFVSRNTGCSVEIVLFPRIFIILPPLPRQHWATIGCTNIGQHPIGVTVHSHCVESFEKLLQRYVGEGWVEVDNEKNTIFPEHPVVGIVKRLERYKATERSWRSRPKRPWQTDGWMDCHTEGQINSYISFFSKKICIITY